MIFFFAPGGRLGNQIFQLAFLMTVARHGETCVLSRMDGALRLFVPDIKVVSVPDGPLYKVLDKVLIPFLFKPLCWMRVLGTLKDVEGGLQERRGLIPGVRVLTGYFQSETLIVAGVRERLGIARDVLEKAQRYIQSLEAVQSPDKLVFVHIRRTDYLNYYVLGKKDPSLPLEYYNKTIRWFIDNIDHPFFIFVGDDPAYVRENFGWVVDKFISDNDPMTDLAVMSLCKGAVLSNSTLAWWGAKFMENPVKVFAPRFWLGWKSSRWYPQGIEPEFAECVDAE